MQYHVTAQYEYAYHHWILAACWRKEDMDANNFHDQGHLNALRYTIKQAMYNKALYEWQDRRGKVRLPQPEDFGLKTEDIENKEKISEKELEEFMPKSNLTS